MKKLHALFRHDRRFQWAFTVLVLAILGNLWELRLSRLQQADLNTIQDDIALVQRIPELETALQKRQLQQALALKKPEPAQLNPFQFVLKGTSFSPQGHPLAVIDDEIVKEGDSVGDYRVVRIQPGEAILQHEKTRQYRKITLTEAALP